MRLINLIVEALKNIKYPLTQGEILELIEKNPKHKYCEEFSRVAVPRSAIARQLTKYSSGSKPIIKKVEARKFQLIAEDVPNETLLKEFDLHPILVKFAFDRFNVYSKTINAVKIKTRGNKINKWSNPDIAGINFSLLNLNDLFQSEVEKQGIVSNKVAQFFSFELKLKIDKSNLTECYFQAVSNSSWANFGYLVVGDLDKNKNFISNLVRLNSGYGIGVIHLNINEPEKSEIIVSAREREAVDINFMNYLSNINKDFYNFIKISKKIINTKKIENDFFDKKLI
ncbi:MAG: hypothetical protein A3H67_03460 [Candidatus Buchananbacteria bacterium RIFCSPLOWO2_02_FULL_46_11b]|uniref:HTH HARE-type domain-containing protein n=1 Tax=Candidatus Buchananbacteria bacterium RIFCSPLOWO2_02_FULL_46_11b TaxID=1797548 RepID=A0A1G1YZF7_9BACT|nr:MAG: hypothetical protein A3H67_03460 [Candidatus Buchananbacteria bacterium RIFCSPLOWO2_02_FULL_46_11b]